MPLTIARFDLDESVPIPNVAKPSPTIRAILPNTFPFVFDEAAQEVVEPILIYLADKFTVPKAFVDGRWIKDNSAGAAAADLKDWWAKIQAGDVPWDCADDSLVADWLVDMRTTVSGKTNDFLSDKTVVRRASSVAEFYRWALDRKLVERVPNPDSARRLADVRLTDPTVARNRKNATRGKYDIDAHPIPPKKAAQIADKLGPLPSMNSDAPSRTRLAFELGYETGMRIDEILHLPFALFEDFDFLEQRPFVMTSIDIEHTKGLVPREVNIPAWLMHELSLYVAGERAAAIKRARKTWLTDGQLEPWQLLVNHSGSAQHPGKATQAATIQAEFHDACMALNITKRRVLAKGTPEMKVVRIPRHTFHDTRHSFAVLFFRALEARGRKRPWLRVQKALGHAHISTTTGIYLNVVDELASEALELVAATFRAIRDKWRGQNAAKLADLEEELA